jgi:hypothetical protein
MSLLLPENTIEQIEFKVGSESFIKIDESVTIKVLHTSSQTFINAIVDGWWKTSTDTVCARLNHKRPQGELSYTIQSSGGGTENTPTCDNDITRYLNKAKAINAVIQLVQSMEENKQLLIEMSKEHHEAELKAENERTYKRNQTTEKKRLKFMETHVSNFNDERELVDKLKAEAKLNGSSVLQLSLFNYHNGDDTVAVMKAERNKSQVHIFYDNERFSVEEAIKTVSSSFRKSA